MLQEISRGVFAYYENRDYWVAVDVLFDEFTNEIVIVLENTLQATERIPLEKVKMVTEISESELDEFMRSSGSEERYYFALSMTDNSEKLLCSLDKEKVPQVIKSINKHLKRLLVNSDVSSSQANLSSFSKQKTRLIIDQNFTYSRLGMNIKENLRARFEQADGTLMVFESMVFSPLSFSTEPTIISLHPDRIVFSFKESGETRVFPIKSLGTFRFANDDTSMDPMSFMDGSIGEEKGTKSLTISDSSSSVPFFVKHGSVFEIVLFYLSVMLLAADPDAVEKMVDDLYASPYKIYTHWGKLCAFVFSLACKDNSYFEAALDLDNLWLEKPLNPSLSHLMSLEKGTNDLGSQVLLELVLLFILTYWVYMPVPLIPPFNIGPNDVLPDEVPEYLRHTYSHHNILIRDVAGAVISLYFLQETLGTPRPEFEIFANFVQIVRVKDHESSAMNREYLQVLTQKEFCGVFLEDVAKTVFGQDSFGDPNSRIELDSHILESYPGIVEDIPDRSLTQSGLSPSYSKSQPERKPWVPLQEGPEKEAEPAGEESESEDFGKVSSALDAQVLLLKLWFLFDAVPITPFSRETGAIEADGDAYSKNNFYLILSEIRDAFKSGHIIKFSERLEAFLEEIAFEICDIGLRTSSERIALNSIKAKAIYRHQKFARMSGTNVGINSNNNGADTGMSTRSSKKSKKSKKRYRR